MAAYVDPEPDWWGADLLGAPPGSALWAQAGHGVTYHTLRTQVAHMRRLFDAYGIRSGHTVALQGAHSFSQLWALFALWSCGAQVMLMGPHVRGKELGRQLDWCRPQFHVSFNAPGHGKETFHDECEVFVRRLLRGRPAATDHCLVQFTSGSTGFAKAIGRTPESLLTELERFKTVGGMPEPGSRVLVLGPLAHSFSLVGGVLYATSTRSTVLLAPDSGRRTVLRTAIRSGADTIIGSPQHFAALAQIDRPVRIPRLRLAISGGEQMAHRVYTRFAERHRVRIGQAYGTTETGIIATDPTGWYGPDTVGMPVPGLQLRLADGELQVRLDRSPYLPQAGPPGRFLPDGEHTRAGWLRTRDLVEQDPASGALRVLGRFDPLADRRALTRGLDQILLADRTLVRHFERDGHPVG
ncbi:class I adenylate-forming enzyme family protein [Streptomyces sp. Rer75]|uniref:class I adenylate-forming enzyme family protein n=1 Tax=unclassified Streptomyces TaxID=2593676 RepID=UPI0015CF86EF|nr:AMP-binding protein [Streptomyces sp. Rer75]QLH25554.1 AMP-binding protein [Streptomyces sp. Rer75]